MSKLLLVLLVLLLTAGHSLAAKVALVIGNDAYLELQPLAKAVADARSYGGLLEEKGYLFLGVDQTRLQLDESIARFLAIVQPGDTAVFVYAGHGWSNGRENFLVATDTPVDVSPELLTRLSFPVQNGVNGIIDQLEARGAMLNVVILDACRNNPFTDSGTRGASLSRGLSRVDPPSGTFVIFSAGTGQQALDQLTPSDPDPNGVFTRVFIPVLQANLPILDAIKEPRSRSTSFP